MNELDEIFKSIKKNLESIPNSCHKLDFMEHLRSLARKEEPMDYPEVSHVDFPEKILIAYAVCHPECGAREFIVDGSTQECQHCGGLMFRTEVAEYRLVQNKTK
jgi:hypothetical protein